MVVFFVRELLCAVVASCQNVFNLFAVTMNDHNSRAIQMQKEAIVEKWYKKDCQNMIR